MKKLIHAIQNGVFIGLMISIITSLIFSNGKYAPLYPGSFMGEIYYNNFDEPIIMLISVGIWAMIGVLFTYGNMIFTDTDWSITKQTVVHFLMILTLFFPLAILAGWFPLNLESIASFIIIFTVIYIAMWFGTLQSNKKMVNEINEKLGR
ncbi:DUF3021 domain-containing protein [Macrococcoides canis]|uniref:DUF3021 domain-containing protein n=1 Tax=Macrococcoides canis TaxID=1855823 RepID=UPI0020B81360|nr:DUF3021 domain-containing protein [Macrococcus canis]UTG99784.1 DUF3021 domain-containing protein [Macrococcus canis]WBF53226.1 DUF3021 domain-containing protein [Macrococcus canis]